MSTANQNIDSLSDDPNHTGRIKVKDHKRFRFSDAPPVPYGSALDIDCIINTLARLKDEGWVSYGIDNHTVIAWRFREETDEEHDRRIMSLKRAAKRAEKKKLKELEEKRKLYEELKAQFEAPTESPTESPTEVSP